MAEKQLRVLLVEDADDDAELLLLHLHRIGYRVHHERVETAEAMRAALARPWDLILSDFDLPGFSATEALDLVKRLDKELPFIIVSGTLGEEAAVAALKGGADDFIVKGKLARLGGAIERALARVALRRELRETENRLAQAQKLEAIGRLAGGIAHDFNNLLSVVLSYSHLLLENSTPDMPGYDETQEIQRAGESARDLTRQLLAFSRRQVRNMRAVDVNESLRGVTKMLTRVLGEDIELVTDLAEGLSRVRADPGQLEQVVMNLAVNARDAMPEGGTLRISTTETDDHEVCVSFADTGMGMDEATQARIFDPFFTTKEPGKGTGLGLSTVFGIVQQSGGHIAVRSAPGAGATFDIVLPAFQGTESGVHQLVEVSPAAGGTETVLVVEDDEHLRRVVGTILRRAGYDVIEAPHGLAAFEAFRTRDRRIHLLLTDVVMPKMNGRELGERVASLDADVRVIFMSGYPDEMIVSHGVLDGKASFVAKPVTPEALRRSVRQVLDARPGEIV